MASTAHDLMGQFAGIGDPAPPGIMVFLGVPESNGVVSPRPRSLWH
jgi:hypothetical protein